MAAASYNFDRDALRLATHQRKLRNRRSHCRRMLKDKYAIDGKNLTIELPFARLGEVPTPDRYYVRQLLKLGYQIQTSLF